MFWACSGVKVSGLGRRVSPLLSLFLCPHGDAEGVPGWPRGRAGKSAGVYGPLVRLCMRGDVGDMGTDIWVRPFNCGETLKASGTALGWRHPTNTMAAWRLPSAGCRALRSRTV